MWMLVRADAYGDLDADPVLAASPDSPGGGDEWVWSVERALSSAGPTIRTRHDDDAVHCTRTDHGASDVVDVVRAVGEEVIIVATRGEHLVTHTDGPWQHWLRTGDVLVLEGEDVDRIRLTTSPADCLASIVHFRPRGTTPLRWVP